MFAACVYNNNLCTYIIIGKSNGDIEAVISNPVVPQSVLAEILLWRSEGATDIDVITRLRQRTDTPNSLR